MARAVISENSMVFLDVSPTIEETGNPANRTLSVNDSVNVQGSGKGTLDTNDFFAMFDEIWSKLLMLAKQLRDTMQFYNQKKQELSWGLRSTPCSKVLKPSTIAMVPLRPGRLAECLPGC
jgi:secreted effector protein SseD